MLTKFTDRGYGVVIGEYAVMGAADKHDRDKFYANLLDNCDLYNYCPVLWAAIFTKGSSEKLPMKT